MDEQAGQTPPTVRRRIGWIVVAGILAPVVLLALWWFAPWQAATPVTITGMAYANSDATAIGFDADSRSEAARRGLSAEGEAFNVAGVIWTDVDGTTYEGSQPTCLEPGETVPVELSFVRVRYGAGEGGPTRVVTGLRCLN